MFDDRIHSPMNAPPLPGSFSMTAGEYALTKVEYEKMHKKTSGTLKTLWDAFELTYRLHWKGSKNEEKAVANFMSTILILGKEYPAANVDSETILSLVDTWKREGLSNGTVNRKLSALMRVLGVAHRAGMRLTPPPPTVGLKEAPHRTRTLTDDEINGMVGAMSRASGQLVRFLVETGMRVSEALSLTWADIMWQSTEDMQGVAVSALVRRSKSDRPRTVPLTKTAAGVVRQLRDERTVFGYGVSKMSLWTVPQRSFNFEWEGARRLLGLQGDKEFVPHALRHTCASRLVARGVPLAVVQKWLGHRTIQMTMRYAHVGDESLEAAARLMETMP